MIREYNTADNAQIVALFFDTVHTINAKDYTSSQLAVWAPANINIDQWCAPLATDDTRIAVQGGKIVGFANLEATGHLDRLYVHKDTQGQGIATRLLWEIEAHARTCGIHEITSDVSITARPFFAKQGYIVAQENIVLRENEQLLNYKMRKSISSD